jgi:predicted nucleic acid-binding Zn ribbon protein
MDAAFEDGGEAVLTMSLDLTGSGPLPVTGTTNGRDHFSNAAWGTFENYAEAYWTGSGWYVTDGNSVWTSTDDVATPDLITNWTGDEPFPVLTMEGGGGLDASAVVDCWDSEQLEAVRTSICSTLCQLMDAAFAIEPEEGSEPVLNMALDLTGSGPLPVTGTTNGRDHYSNAAWGTYLNYAEAYWAGSGWYVTDGVNVWTSTDDVATPDLIENWTGDAPYPVLTMEGGEEEVDVGAQQIVDCWDSEQRERIEALVCTSTPGTVKTTDGEDTVLTVAPGGTENLPQMKIFFEDPDGDLDQTTGYDTGLDGGLLFPDALVPRRQVMLTGGTGTGIYATLARLLAGTLPTIPQQLNITWAAGAGDTLGVVLPASMQGVAFSFVSETGSNGTITVSVNNGSSFAAPPFTASTAKVIFRRTTTTSEHSALFATA